MTGTGSPALGPGALVDGVTAVLLRVAAAATLSVGAVVAVVGAVLAPASVLVAAALVSLLLLVLPLTPLASTRPLRDRRTTWRLLLAVAAAPPLTAGLHLADVPSQVLSAVVLGAASAVLVWWMLRWDGHGHRNGQSTAGQRTAGQRTAGQGTAGQRTAGEPLEVRQSPEALADLFGVLPLEALFAEGRALRRASAHASAAERDRLVSALSLLLTELHRRDPHAARQWLDQRPTDPPDRWFGEPHGHAA